MSATDAQGNGPEAYGFGVRPSNEVLHRQHADEIERVCGPLTAEEKKEPKPRTPRKKP